jgi:hypothetical protein
MFECRVMADQSNNPVGCLGRVLTFIGVAWLLVVVLAGMGLLSEFGLAGGVVAWVGGSFIPALLLLAAGRALRRRARTMDGDDMVTIPPNIPGKRVPTTRPESTRPAPTPPLIPGRAPPTSRPVPRQLDPLPPPATARPSSLEDVIPPPPVSTGPEPKPVAAPPPVDRSTARPKTSRELVEEARKKWGGTQKR